MIGRGRRSPRAALAAFGVVLGLWQPAAMADRELAGMTIAEELRIDPEATKLFLQGAHVRTYLFRDITLFALYAAEPSSDFATLAASPGAKRVAVTVLRSEFSAESFRAGWRQQFDAALSVEEQQRLAPQIAEFIETFETLKRGDQLAFDFVADAVRVSVRGSEKRVIRSREFAVALLGVWLGPRSVDAALRRALLGSSMQEGERRRSPSGS